MNFYTAYDQLRPRFRDQKSLDWIVNEEIVSMLEQPGAAYGLDPSPEERIGSRLIDAIGHPSAKSFVDSAPDADHLPSEPVQRLLSVREVGVVGLGGSQRQHLQLMRMFGGVGERLADVASENYRIPRVTDPVQRAKAEAAIALLDGWLEEENDPAEAREWEQLKADLDEDRSSPRKLFL